MTVIFDGNSFISTASNIAISSIFKHNEVLKNGYTYVDPFSNSLELKDTAKYEFAKYVLKYMTSIIKSVKNVNCIVFTFDDFSWRKRYIKHSEKADFVYKSNRQHDESKFMLTKYFYNEIIPTFEKNVQGFRSIRIQNWEADDIIAEICKRTSGDICVWSGDMDMTQLAVNSDDKSIFISCPKSASKTKRVFTAAFSSRKEEEKSAMDILLDESESSGELTVESLVKEWASKDFLHVIVDPRHVVLSKILGGDTSDTIPRAHPKLTPAKVESTVESIINLYPNILQLIDDASLEALKVMTDESSKILKISKDQSLVDDLFEKIKINTRLIRLNSRFIPNEVRERFQDDYLKNIGYFSYSKFEEVKKTILNNATTAIEAQI